MRWASLSRKGRMANRLATWFAPSFYARLYLSRWGANGYVSPRATVMHPGLRLGPKVHVDDEVLIFQDCNGGPVVLGEDVHLWRGCIIQTGEGGSVEIGDGTHIQPRCQFSAYKGAIRIGARVEIAPNCAFYPYDHGIEPDRPLSQQPLTSKGPIIVEDDAWLGVGVTVLSGVRIGKGAIIAAGSVVTRDVPEGVIAAGVPAKVVKMRGEAAARL